MVNQGYGRLQGIFVLLGAFEALRQRWAGQNSILVVYRNSRSSCIGVVNPLGLPESHSLIVDPCFNATTHIPFIPRGKSGSYS